LVTLCHGCTGLQTASLHLLPLLLLEVMLSHAAVLPGSPFCLLLLPTLLFLLPPLLLLHPQLLGVPCCW
jgi:hypothetical protein